MSRARAASALTAALVAGAVLAPAARADEVVTASPLPPATCSAPNPKVPPRFGGLRISPVVRIRSFPDLPTGAAAFSVTSTTDATKGGPIRWQLDVWEAGGAQVGATNGATLGCERVTIPGALLGILRPNRLYVARLSARYENVTPWGAGNPLADVPFRAAQVASWRYGSFVTRP